MSRTVRDLVEAMRDGEELAFDADAVWLRSQQRARQLTVRRRAAVAVVAGAAVVVAIAAPSMILSPRSSAPGPAASSTAAPSIEPTTPSPTVVALPTRATLSATLRAVSSSEWIIAPAATAAPVQLAYARRATETKMFASIEVYEAKEFDPGPLLDGTPTTVDGVTAYVADVEDPFSGDENGEHRTIRPTIAWQYAPDSWAVVRSDDPPRAPGEVPQNLRDIAELVEIGEPEPVRLPFRVGYRPAGLVPVSVRHFEEAEVNRFVGYHWPSAPVDFRDPDADFQYALRIGMKPALPEFWRPDTTVGGRPAMRNGLNEVIIADGDLWITIGSGIHQPPLSTEEIEQIYAGLTFADWNDQTTWFDANDAA